LVIEGKGSIIHEGHQLVVVESQNVIKYTQKEFNPLTQIFEEYI
jgi:hypothetical protein